VTAALGTALPGPAAAVLAPVGASLFNPSRARSSPHSDNPFIRTWKEWLSAMNAVWTVNTVDDTLEPFRAL
jgi:hypothetical protein